MPPLRGQQIDDQIGGDPGKPGPKRASPWIGVVSLDGAGDRAEDVLNQVFRVGVLKSPSPRKLMHQGTIDLGKLGPGPLVSRIAKPDQETGLRARCVVHPPFLRMYSPPSRDSLNDFVQNIFTMQPPSTTRVAPVI